MVIAITVIVNKIIIVSPDWVVTDYGRGRQINFRKKGKQSLQRPMGSVKLYSQDPAQYEADPSGDTARTGLSPLPGTAV